MSIKMAVADLISSGLSQKNIAAFPLVGVQSRIDTRYSVNRFVMLMDKLIEAKILKMSRHL